MKTEPSLISLMSSTFSKQVGIFPAPQPAPGPFRALYFANSCRLEKIVQEYLMATVLYYGNDDRLPKILEGFFELRKTDAGEVHGLSHIKDPKKLEESVVAFSYDLIFVEQAIMDRGPVEWLTSFTKKFTNVKCPVLLLGDERNPTKIIKIIEGGYTDYIVNPPDKPLILEKFVIYTTGKRNRDLRQVYSLKLSQTADLAKPGFLEELSEFDCKVRSFQKIPINELMLLYAPSFSHGGTEKEAVLVRCYESQEHPSFKEQFVSSFYFVGATPETLVHIRKSLQKAYVASKAKG